MFPPPDVAVAAVGVVLEEVEQGHHLIEAVVTGEDDMMGVIMAHVKRIADGLRSK